MSTLETPSVYSMFFISIFILKYQHCLNLLLNLLPSKSQIALLSLRCFQTMSDHRSRIRKASDIWKATVQAKYLKWKTGSQTHSLLNTFQHATEKKGAETFLDECSYSELIHMYSDRIFVVSLSSYWPSISSRSFTPYPRSLNSSLHAQPNLLWASSSLLSCFLVNHSLSVHSKPSAQTFLHSYCEVCP